MEKTFCIAGPIQPEDHYHLPFRMNEAQLMQLIEQKKYFILHAPRQSGKTTAIEWLVDKLNATGTYEALYVNIEAAQADRANYVRGIATVVMRLKMGIAAQEAQRNALAVNALAQEQVQGAVAAGLEKIAQAQEHAVAVADAA